MPRGHKRDYTETAARNFHSEYSFVGLDGRDYIDHQSKDWEERKEELLIRDGGKCHICAGVGSDPHHIIPLGSSGSDDLSQRDAPGKTTSMDWRQKWLPTVKSRK